MHSALKNLLTSSQGVNCNNTRLFVASDNLFTICIKYVRDLWTSSFADIFLFCNMKVTEPLLMKVVVMNKYLPANVAC